MSSRYGIAEWFGHPFRLLPPSDRQALARAALKFDPALPCRFSAANRPAANVAASAQSSQATANPSSPAQVDLERETCCRLGWRGSSGSRMYTWLPKCRSCVRRQRDVQRGGLILSWPATEMPVHGSGWKFRRSTSPETECWRTLSCCGTARTSSHRSQQLCVVRTGARPAQNALCRNFRSRDRRCEDGEPS